MKWGKLASEHACLSAAQFAAFLTLGRAGFTTTGKARVGKSTVTRGHESVLSCSAANGLERFGLVTITWRLTGSDHDDSWRQVELTERGWRAMTEFSADLVIEAVPRLLPTLGRVFTGLGA